MAEVKSLQFPNTPSGQAQKVRVLQRETAQGWRIVSETIIPGKFKGGKACCLFLIFAPCAFLAGHTDDIISVTLQRGGSDDEVRSQRLNYDRKKWTALLQYDSDVATAAQQLNGLDQKWTDELASAYLTLNDKKYLPDILARIVDREGAERGEAERLRAVAEQRRMQEEQERLIAEQQQREQREHIYRTFLGTREKKIWFAVIVVAVVLFLIAVIVRAANSIDENQSERVSSVVPTPTAVQSANIAPSFDCSRVHSEVLKLVCATPALERADQDLARAYREAMSATHNPVALRKSQRAWISRRNNSSADPILLQAMYEARVAYLRSLSQ